MIDIESNILRIYLNFHIKKKCLHLLYIGYKELFPCFICYKCNILYLLLKNYLILVIYIYF